jgi:hypothetical protein
VVLADSRRAALIREGRLYQGRMLDLTRPFQPDDIARHGSSSALCPK